MKLIITIIITTLFLSCKLKSGVFVSGTQQNSIKSTSKFLTRAENDTWISELDSTMLLHDKIIKIRKKILSDSIYKHSIKYIKIGYYLHGDRLVNITDEMITKEKKISDCECKIKFYLVINNTLYSLDNVDNERIENIFKLLNTNTIKGISIDEKYTQIDYLNEISWCSLVLIYSEHKELNVQVKKIINR